MCGNPFKFSLVDEHDQKYLDRQQRLSNAMSDDELDEKPSHHTSYQYSSTLRNITLRLHAGADPAALAREAQSRKNATRVTPTQPVDLEALQLSKFEASSGAHEWIPTDKIGEVVKLGSQRWMFYFNVMRCPTWLLVLHPSAYHASYQAYAQLIEKAAAHARAGGSGFVVKASELMLNGHSGGLSMDRIGQSAKPLTVFQALWHDALRNIFATHAAGNDYQGWASALNDFMLDTFLFARSADALPGVPIDVTAMEVMQRIEWDLNLSDRGEKNPIELGPPPYGMDVIAAFLHREWNAHLQLLSNNYNAGEYFKN